MTEAGFSPKRQNVSINIRVNGYDVDLVPAKRQNQFSEDHSLYRRKADTWTKTNIQKHITHVIAANWLPETRIIKLWRNQKGIDFPSFYLELAVIKALVGSFYKTGLAADVWKVFQFLSDGFLSASIQDPANTNNMISDDLTVAERFNVKSAAASALKATNWNQIVL